MRRVALIPARGGSKRLPRKNVADFLGRPILAYTAEAALESGLFERVVVSSEDPEILDIASRCCEVDARPAALATDTARVLDVCLEFLDRQEAEGRSYDVLCCLYATAPMRTARDMAGVVGLLEPGVCGFAMAVAAYPLPPQQALVSDGRGGLRAMWPELLARRSQDVPRMLCDNGSTYAVLVEDFRRGRSFYGPGLRGFEMPFVRSVDIDEPDDLVLATALARELWT